MIDNELVQALAVTAEICGTTLSEGAAVVLAQELAEYDRAQILGALKNCRRELKSRLTMGAILERIEDGRPGSDEAFAMLPTSDAQTVVWTDEMAAAAGFRDSEADNMTQRLAFREAYTKAVSRAREARIPPRWWVSMGYDTGARDAAVAAAVAVGRLTVKEAHDCGVLLPAPSGQMLQIAEAAQRRRAGL
jgi:hypothetical protein